MNSLSVRRPDKGGAGLVLGRVYQQGLKEKVFKLGDKISLNINEFNGISYTCATFATGLFPLMPQPK